MNAGKTLFAQLMDFLPWKTFTRIVARHQGDRGVRTLSCLELFRVLAFAQLTYRESLRDIEVCLSAQAGKLYHMGLRQAPPRSPLADALALRDWRIYFEFAQRLIVRARALYASERLDVDLDETVYALDATTIDLCLSVFDRAPFRSTKAAIKLHTLLDLRGPIPTFIHISDGKMHDVNVLDLLPIETGAFYVMDRGYLDFARLPAASGAGLLRDARQNPFGCAASVLGGRGSQHRPDLRSDHRAQRLLLGAEVSANAASDPLQDPASGKMLVFLTNHMSLPPLIIAALYKSRWQVELFFKWIKQHLRIKQFYGTSENAVKTQIWCAVCIYVLVAIVRKELQLNVSLYTLLQILSVTVFEKTSLQQALSGIEYTTDIDNFYNQMDLFEN